MNTETQKEIELFISKQHEKTPDLIDALIKNLRYKEKFDAHQDLQLLLQKGVIKMDLLLKLTLLIDNPEWNYTINNIQY